MNVAPDAAVAAMTEAVVSVVPANLTPFLTAELRESAGRKVVSRLLDKGWHLVSDGEYRQLEGNSRALDTLRRQQVPVSEICVDLQTMKAEVAGLADRAQRILARIREG